MKISGHTFLISGLLFYTFPEASSGEMLYSVQYSGTSEENNRYAHTGAHTDHSAVFIRSIVTNYTDQLFSPYDTSQHQASLFFLLQSGLTNENSFKTKFAPDSPIQYEAFDFYEDSGPQDDGDNFIAKVQRADIELLEKLKHKFYSRSVKKLEGFYAGK